MALSICADNLKKFEVESEYQAASLKKAALYFLLPSLSIPLFFWSVLFVWKMRQYFKQASLANLSKCYSLDNEVCRTCLKRLYDHEQEMIARLDDGLMKIPLLGHLFARIKDTLEDRAEALILSTDDQAYKAVSRLVAHFSTQDQKVSGWHRQLETLR